MNNKDMAITAATSTDGGDGGWAEACSGSLWMGYNALPCKGISNSAGRFLP